MQNSNTAVDSGQAFLVDYINSALPESQPARAEAYGRVQALSGHTLPPEAQAA